MKLTSIDSQPAQTTFSLRRRRRPAASTLFLFLWPLFLHFSYLSPCLSLHASDRTLHLYELPAHEHRPTNQPAMSRWFKIPAALRRSDAEDATVTQPQPTSPTQSQRQGSSESSEVGHGRNSESDESVPSGSELHSPTKSGKENGKRSLFKRGSRNYNHEKENGGSLSIAKRVKSSLHLNSTVNGLLPLFGLSLIVCLILFYSIKHVADFADDGGVRCPAVQLRQEHLRL